MKCKAALRTTVAMLTLVLSSQAAVPTQLTHQGRLLDSSDQPVTGMRDFTFHIYDVETGGAPLWTESHPGVSVSDGLFQVTLGGTVAISADMLVTTGTFDPTKWLEVVVNGTTLSPRMRLGSVPFAIGTHRVSGDVETSPGQLLVRGIQDPDKHTELITLCNADGSSVTMIDSNKTDHSSARAGWTTSNPGIGSVSGGALRMEIDDDGDGVPESELSQIITPTTSAVAIKTKGTGADKNRTIGGSCDDSLAVVYLDADDDGDGNSEAKANIAAVFNGNTVIGLTTDADDDGDPESEISQFTSPASSGVAIKTKGTGADPRRSTILSTADLDSAVVASEYDDDGDGHPQTVLKGIVRGGQASYLLSWDFDGDDDPEKEISQIVTPTTASVAIKTKGTGADKNRTIGGSCDDSLAVVYLDADDDGDGNSEAKANIAAVLNGSTVIGLTTDADDDGDPESEISQFTAPTGSGMAIKTKGTGAQRGEMSIDHDSDDDGLSDVASSVSCDSAGGLVAVSSTLSNGDINTVTMTGSKALPRTEVVKKIWATGHSNGVTTSALDGPDGVVGELAIEEEGHRRVTLEGSSTGGSLEIVAGVAIPKFIDITARESSGLPGGSGGVSLVMGVGADSLVELMTDDSSSSLSLSNNSLSHNWRMVSLPTSSRMTATDGSGVVALDINGDGRIGLGGDADATNPIQHSSGAHLTAGGDWTNASDENLKENFSDINGEELLEKIESLPIQQWNYKNEEESVTHIGPTAQDFKKAFGVGSDDKSISTIDPSGIALAAIKELSKQNQELAKQNQKLQKELENLKKQVQEIVSKR